jgi:hypothetical protein
MKDSIFVTAEELFGEPIEPMTPEQVEQGWTGFLALDLAGRRLEYGGHSGDEWKVRATIVAVHSTPDVVTVEVKDVETTPERDGVPDRWESVALTEICLDRRGDPPNTEGNIVLPLAMLTEQIFGTEIPCASFEIGFIW